MMTPVSLLLDRVDERNALDHLLADAERGVGGACVVIGDPGMGKTRLLEYAVSSVPDLQSVWITGIAAETTLGYAGLHRLLGPFLGHSEVLPSRQRHALEAALGLSDEAPADVFLVGLACAEPDGPRQSGLRLARARSVLGRSLGVGHQAMRADEPDVHLAGHSARVVAEVEARSERPLVGDLQVDVHAFDA